MSVVIETSIGDITVDLYTDERKTCCQNFIKLCQIKYYNFCSFHNIQRNFIAQTGDPTGTGRGGESIFTFLYGNQARYFEMERFPKIKHRKRGTLSMINNGSDHHGSQFFITLAENLTYLDDKHTVFGEVAKGFDVLDKLNEWICDKEGRPYQDIKIFHTVVLFDPWESMAADLVASRSKSPEPTDELLDSGDRIRCDEDIDQLEGMTEAEIETYMKEREAKTRAKLLEIIGDIPDAEMAPPENVLFVCKLNPVTGEDDLELIFSRFGKINSCEVIRDRKTGDSLCYAFIEFDRKEDCEAAYFKMDNVLIDDRRIHVDFSQSVSKVQWRGKGTNSGYFDDKRDFRGGGGFGKEEAAPPKFQVKDKSRRGEGYALVFGGDEDDGHDKRYERVDDYKRRARDEDSSRNKRHHRDYDNGDRHHHRDDRQYHHRERSDNSRDRHERKKHHHRDRDDDDDRYDTKKKHHHSSSKKY